MNDPIDDWNAQWWHAQECDEQWIRHQQQRAELNTIRKELEHESQRNDTEQVAEKRGH